MCCRALSDAPTRTDEPPNERYTAGFAYNQLASTLHCSVTNCSASDAVDCCATPLLYVQECTPNQAAAVECGLALPDLRVAACQESHHYYQQHQQLSSFR
jgi:hypothetical protein